MSDIPNNDLVLAFDTETTGLPLWHEPSDAPGQPHVVQLAMELCSSSGDVIEVYDRIINIGQPIPPDMTAIHGITDEMAAAGVSPEHALTNFFRLVEQASVLTGYNVSFDMRMMRIQAARHFGEKWDCPIPHFDTCFAAKDVCKIPAKTGGLFKKPKLGEAVSIIFGEKHENAHTAMADTIAARRLYFHLRNTMEPMLPKRERIGANNPPVEEAVIEDGRTPFEKIKGEIDDLYGEARNWLDGEPIANEAQASEVAKLRDKLRDAASRAEKLRKDEAKPFDDGKAEVQARFNPLIQKDRGSCDLAIKTCNTALAPFLKAKDDAQREAARKAQQDALRLASEARDAARASATSTNIAQHETAESMLADAAAAIKSAKHLEAAKPQVNGGVRAIGLKSVFTPELIDPAAAIAHYRVAQPGKLKEWLIEQARIDVRAGKHDPDAIPGFTIKEDRVPV